MLSNQLFFFCLIFLYHYDRTGIFSGLFLKKVNSVLWKKAIDAFVVCVVKRGLKGSWMDIYLLHFMSQVM